MKTNFIITLIAMTFVTLNANAASPYVSLFSGSIEEALTQNSIIISDNSDGFFGSTVPNMLWPEEVDGQKIKETSSKTFIIEVKPGIHSIKGTYYEKNAGMVYQSKNPLTQYFIFEKGYVYLISAASLQGWNITSQKILLYKEGKIFGIEHGVLKQSYERKINKRYFDQLKTLFKKNKESRQVFSNLKGNNIIIRYNEHEDPKKCTYGDFKEHDYIIEDK